VTLLTQVPPVPPVASPPIPAPPELPVVEPPLPPEPPVFVPVLPAVPAPASTSLPALNSEPQETAALARSSQPKRNVRKLTMDIP